MAVTYELKKKIKQKLFTEFFCIELLLIYILTVSKIARVKNLTEFVIVLDKKRNNG